MKSKSQAILIYLFRNAVILPSLVLAASLTYQPAIFAQTPETPAESLSEEQQELERLRQERELQDQVQAEANRIFSRTMLLFNLMLGLLAILLGGAIVALWILRRSVIHEVTGIVESHLNELGDLEHRVSTGNRKLEAVLQNTEDLTVELHQEADRFEQDLNHKRDRFETLESELVQSKKQTVAGFQQIQSEVIQAKKQAVDNFNQFKSELGESKQQTLEDFAKNQAELVESKQQTVDNFEKTQAELVESKKQALVELEKQLKEAQDSKQKLEEQFAKRLSELQQAAQQQQAEILQGLQQAGKELTADFSQLKAEVKGNKDSTLKNVKSL
jgi:hypothetical protein